MCEEPVWINIKEWKAKTRYLSAAESIAVLHLLMYHRSNGGLPDHDIWLAKLADMTPRQWDKSKAAIMPIVQEAIRKLMRTNAEHLKLVGGEQ